MTLRSNRLGPSLLAVTLALALVAAPAAFADVMPEGKKQIDVTHALEGAASVGPQHTLMLVTGNDRYRESLTITLVKDGDLDVPGGYRSWSYLVALTKPQIVAIAKAALATPTYADAAAKLGNDARNANNANNANDDALVAWVTGGGVTDDNADPENEEGGKGPHAVLTAGDVARSGTLPFRSFVDQDAATQRIHMRWKVSGVVGGELQLAVAESHFGVDDKIVAEPGESPSWLPYAGGAVAVLLLALVILGWRRRAA